MIYGIVGDVGEGKTLLMTHLGWQMHKQGLAVYSNYHLKFKHVFVSSIEQFFNVPLNHDNLFLLDEAWITADARKSHSHKNIDFSRFLLQARKKKGNVIYTVQDISQIDKRIRINTSFIIRPQIILQIPEKDQLIPYVIKADFYDRGFRMAYSKAYMVYPAHRMYDTFEVVGECKTVRYDVLKEKYREFKGNKRELSALLHFEEGLTKAEASDFTNYLAALKSKEYMEELKDHKGDLDGLIRETKKVM